jgi:excisionase family DNA binding protein
MFAEPADCWLSRVNWALHPEVTIVQDLELLTCREVAILLRISSETVRHLVAAGKLPGRKIGRSWRFPRQAIETFIFTTQNLDVAVAAGDSDER